MKKILLVLPLLLTLKTFASANVCVRNTSSQDLSLLVTEKGSVGKRFVQKEDTEWKCVNVSDKMKSVNLQVKIKSALVDQDYCNVNLTKDSWLEVDSDDSGLICQSFSNDFVSSAFFDTQQTYLPFKIQFKIPESLIDSSVKEEKFTYELLDIYSRNISTTKSNNGFGCYGLSTNNSKENRFIVKVTPNFLKNKNMAFYSVYPDNRNSGEILIISPMTSLYKSLVVDKNYGKSEAIRMLKDMTGIQSKDDNYLFTLFSVDGARMINMDAIMEQASEKGWNSFTDQFIKDFNNKNWLFKNSAFKASKINDRADYAERILKIFAKGTLSLFDLAIPAFPYKTAMKAGYDLAMMATEPMATAKVVEDTISKIADQKYKQNIVDANLELKKLQDKIDLVFLNGCLAGTYTDVATGQPYNVEEHAEYKQAAQNHIDDLRGKDYIQYLNHVNNILAKMNAEYSPDLSNSLLYGYTVANEFGKKEVIQEQDMQGYEAFLSRYAVVFNTFLGSLNKEKDRANFIQLSELLNKFNNDSQLHLVLNNRKDISKNLINFFRERNQSDKELPYFYYHEMKSGKEFLVLQKMRIGTTFGDTFDENASVVNGRKFTYFNEPFAYYKIWIGGEYTPTGELAKRLDDLGMIYDKQSKYFMIHRGKSFFTWVADMLSLDYSQPNKNPLMKPKMERADVNDMLRKENATFQFVIQHQLPK